jgi:hypothetical protein
MLITAALCAIVPAVRYFTDPERYVEAMQAQLERGEVVSLIGATGSPRRQAWILEGTPGTDHEGCFTIHSGLVSLLELLPGELPAQFRFEAEIRADGDGDVGLFLGYDKHSFSSGDLHAFLALWFNDKNRDFMHLNLEPMLLSQQIGAKLKLRGLGITRKIGLGPKGQRRLWHKLGIEVSHENVEIECDGKKEGTFSKQQRQDSAKWLLNPKTIPGLKPPDLGNFAPEFSPHKALGLYVANSSASFRNVVVIPSPGK